MSNPTETMIEEQLEALRGTLIVSCQAYPGEPMRDPGTMAQIAAAARIGGAAAIRAQGVEDIRAVRTAVDAPVIGLIKDGDAGVFITPTLDHCLAVIEAGADILALDGTTRVRPDGRTLAETVAAVRERWPGPIMADCDTVEAGVQASAAGCTIIGTTLAGYTDAREKTAGPDLALIGELRAALLDAFIVAEGRIHRPEQAAAALAAGADAVAVGTAITHPTTITGWFAEAIADA